MNAITAGPDDGPAVVLLHGFPEFWYCWQRQIGPLAAVGFRVIVPDQRGYNLSSKPPAVRDYAMRELTADVLAIADQIGSARLLLAGHDWGAAVAWSFAMRYPQRVEKLAILNVPHPAVMLRFLRTRPRQMLRSWYIAFFQLPELPEFLISRAQFAIAANALIRSSRPGTFSTEDLDRCRAAWAQPGAMTAMINWYRAIPCDIPRQARVSVPVRILWGRRDRFLLPEMARESLRYCDRGDLLEFPRATHWLQHEEPDAVNRALISFFT